MWLFWWNKIEITLDKLSYNVWETISWTVKYDFGEKVVKADKFTVSLIRTEEKYYQNDWNKNHDTQHILIAWVTLDQKWEFSKDEKTFSFQVPSNAVPQFANNLLPEWISSVLNLFTWNFPKAPVYKYYLEARFDIPWAIDKTEKINLNISEN